METVAISKQIVDQLIKAGQDPEELTITYAGFYFRHIYMEWLSLLDAYPYEKAVDLYLKGSWNHPRFGLGPSFKAFVKNRKLEVNDIESFAKAMSEQWKGFPIRLDVLKVSDEEVIMENPTGFCPNPAFSPRSWDSYRDRAVYANVDGWQGTPACLTVPDVGYLNVVPSLKDKCEVEMLGAVCLGFPSCKWVIRKKKAKPASS